MKNRRAFMKAGVVAAAAAGTASAQTALPLKKVVHYRSGKKPDKTPRFNQAVSYGNLLFIAGKGYHKEGDIKVHTKAVLDDLGVPHEEGFFAKDADVSGYLKDGWRQRAWEKFRGAFPPAALLFYINHLAWEVAKAEDVFAPAV